MKPGTISPPPASILLDAFRQLGRGLDRLDFAARKNERGILVPESAVENPGAGNGLWTCS
jgi:hypothetical protein